jgi:ParB family chromosome partitioning protein
VANFDVGALKNLNVPINQLTPNPDQPRKYFDPAALEELTSSIKTYGVLQPVIYYTDESGKHIIVAHDDKSTAKGFDIKRVASFVSTLTKEFQKTDINIPMEEKEGIKNNLMALVTAINQFIDTQEKK